MLQRTLSGHAHALGAVVAVFLPGAVGLTAQSTPPASSHQGTDVTIAGSTSRKNAPVTLAASKRAPESGRVRQNVFAPTGASSRTSSAASRNSNAPSVSASTIRA